MQSKIPSPTCLASSNHSIQVRVIGGADFHRLFGGGSFEDRVPPFVDHRADNTMLRFAIINNKNCFYDMCHKRICIWLV